MFTLLKVGSKRSAPQHETTREACTGMWQVTYFSTAPGFDPQTLIGKRLVFFESGAIASPDEGTKELGTWSYDERNRELHLRINGSWPTFLLTNTWELVLSSMEQLGLCVRKSGQFQELHLERAA